jgi:hypothetical protein
MLCRSLALSATETTHCDLQAYLSLPEGMASVVGLIAMMTDHYNVLVRSTLLFFLCGVGLPFFLNKVSYQLFVWKYLFEKKFLRKKGLTYSVVN